MACLNLKNKQVEEWINGVGIENTYTQFILHNNNLPTYKSFLEYSTSNLTNFEVQTIQNKILNTNQFKYDILSRIRSLAPSAQAAFMRDTFYFADKASKAQVAEESFHAIFQTLTTKEEKNKLYEEAKQLNKKEFNRLKEIYKSSIKNLEGESLDKYVLEEILAKEFVNEFLYKNQFITNAVQKTYTERIKDFFNKLYELIKSFGQNKLYKNYFNQIKNGSYKLNTIQVSDENKFPSQSLLSLSREDGTPYTLDTINQRKIYSEIKSIIYGLSNDSIFLSFNDTNIVDKAIELYFEDYLPSSTYKEKEDFGFEYEDHLENNNNPTIITLKKEILEEYQKSNALLEDILDVFGDEETELGSQSFQDQESDNANKVNHYEKKLGKKVKTFMQNIVVKENPNPVVISRNFTYTENGIEKRHTINVPVQRMADPLKIYSIISRTAANSLTNLERLQKTILLTKDSITNSDTHAFVNEVLRKTFDVKDDSFLPTLKKSILEADSIDKIDLYEVKDLYFFNSILKPFDLWRRQQAIFTVDSSKNGYFMMSDPTKTNIRNKQLDAWKNTFEENKIDLYDKLKALPLTALIKRYAQYKDLNKVVDVKLNFNVTKDIFETLGIKVSDNYIKYSIIHNRIEKLKETIYTKAFITREERASLSEDEIVLKQQEIDAQILVNETTLENIIEKEFEFDKEYLDLYNTFKLNKNEVVDLEGFGEYLNTLVIEISPKPRFYKGFENQELADDFINKLKEENLNQIKKRYLTISTLKKDGDSPFRNIGNVVVGYTVVRTEEEIKLKAQNIDPYFNIETLTNIIKENKDTEGNIQVEINEDLRDFSAITRLKSIADGNAYFDESVISTTFLNADNKTVYGMQYHTSLLEMGESKLKNAQKYAEHKKELLQESPDNQFVLNNFLNEFYTTIPDRERSQLEMFSYAGVAAEYFNEQGNKRRGGVKKSTVNELDPNDFAALQANITVQGLSYLSNKKTITQYFVGNPETSNSLSFFTGLWNKDYLQLKNGNIEFTQELIDHLEKSLLQPQIDRIKNFVELLDKNNGVLELGENGVEQIIQDYHTGYIPIVDGKVDIDKLYKAHLSKEKSVPRAMLITKTLDSVISEKGRKLIYENLNNLGAVQIELRQDIVDTFYNFLNMSFEELGGNSFILNTYTNPKKKQNISGFKTSNLEFNYKLFTANAFINRELFNRIYQGDSAILNKDNVEDTLKRFKVIAASGQSAYSEDVIPEFGIYDDFKSFNLVLEQSTSEAISGVTKKVIDDNDGGSDVSVDHYRKFLNGLTKLTTTHIPLFDALQSGRELTLDQKRTLFKTKNYINLLKTRYAGLQTDIKHSETPIYKTLTSYSEVIELDNWRDFVDVRSTMNGKSYVVFPKVGAKREITVEFKDGDISNENFSNIIIKEWYAIDDYKHEKRLLMEGWRKVNNEWVFQNKKIGMISPTSAVKRKKQNIWNGDVNAIFNNKIGDKELFLQNLSTKNLKLQVENPAGKELMTVASQQAEIIQNPFTPDKVVSVKINGEEKNIPVKDLVANLARITAKRDEITLSQALQDLVDENGDTHLKVLYEGWRDSVVDTGGDRQMIEFLELDEKGNPIYNGNIPILQNKYEAYFFSHFSKNALVQKVSGDAKAMSSPKGYGVLKRLIKLDNGNYDWEVVQKLDPTYADKIKKKSANFVRKGLTYNGYLYVNSNAEEGLNSIIPEFDKIYEAATNKNEIYFLDELRHLKPVYNKDGSIYNYFSESVVPAFHEKHGRMQESFKYVNGVRIPSQDLTTSANMMVVDFENALLGNTVWVAKEVQELAGADYDIDKIYMNFKEGYWIGNQFQVYEDTFDDYLKYQFTRNKSVKKQLKDKLNSDAYYLNLKSKTEEGYKKLQELYTSTNLAKKVRETYQGEKLVDVLEEQLFNIDSLNQEINSINTNLENLDGRTKAAKQLQVDIQKRLDSIVEFQNEVNDINNALTVGDTLNRISGIKEKLDDFNNILMNIVYNYKLEVLESNNLNFKRKDYKKGEINAVNNNEILEYMFTLLTSDYEGYSNPTSIDDVKDLQKNSKTTLGLLELIDLEEREGISVHSPLYDSIYRKRNKSAKDGIAVMVNTILSWNVLTRSETKLNENSYIKIDGVVYDKFEKLIKLNGDRVSKWLSSGTTATTDEAKEGQLAKYNLLGEALDVFAVGTSIGIHPELLVTLVNLPFVKSVFQSSAKNKLRSGGVFSIIEELKQLSDGNTEIKELNLTTLKKQLEENKKENKDEFDVNTKLAVYQILQRLLEINEQNKDVTKIIKLKRGFGADYNFLQKTILAVQNLGFLKDIVTPFQVTNRDAYDINFDHPSLTQLKGYIDSLLPKVQDQSNKLLLHGNENFNTIYRDILNQFEVSDYQQQEFIKEIEAFLFRDFIVDSQTSELSRNIYTKDLNLKDLNSSLIVGGNTLARRYVDIMQDESLKETTKNSILFKMLKPKLGAIKTIENLKKLKEYKNVSEIELYKKGLVKDIDTFSLNLFAKVTPEMQSSLMDDFYQLYLNDYNNSSGIKSFLQDLFYYYVVKDGMRFSPTGISKIFPPIMFESVSDNLTKFLEKEYTDDFLARKVKSYSNAIGRDIRNKEYLKSTIKYENGEFNYNNDKDIIFAEENVNNSKFKTKTFSYFSSVLQVRQNEKTKETITNYNILDKNENVIKAINFNNKVYLHLNSSEVVTSNGDLRYIEHYYVESPEMGIKGLYSTLLSDNFVLESPDKIIKNLTTFVKENSKKIQGVNKQIIINEIEALISTYEELVISKKDSDVNERIVNRISELTLEQLLPAFNTLNKEDQELYKEYFTKRRIELTPNQVVKNLQLPDENLGKPCDGAPSM